MPHEQGAWALLCVSGGAVEGTDGGRPTSSAGSAGGQRLRLGIDAPMPHEQGAWALLCVSGGAVEGTDGGRPTSSAGSAGGQRLWLGIDAPMPHEQGAWALLCVSGGAVRGSRRRQAHEQGPAACGGFWGTERCGGMEALVLHLRRRWRNDDGLELRAWGDAALPQRGKGRCGVRRRRCLPRWGKGAAVWRAWFWLVRGEMLFMRRFALQEGLAGAPGGRGKTALLIRSASFEGWQTRPEHGGTGGASRAAKTARSSRGRLVFATIPRGDRRALPAPAQGTSPLGIPFGGTGPISPVSPSPQTPQAASPCSWTCRRLYPPPPHQKRKEASMPPARGAWMRRHGAEGAGCRHCRPEGAGRRHCRPGIILPPPIRARGRRCMRLCPACCQRCR